MYFFVIFLLFSSETAYLQIADVAELEGVPGVPLLPYGGVHGVGVGLIHRHALLGQAARVVDRDVVQLRVVRPVVVCSMFIWLDIFRYINLARYS